MLAEKLNMTPEEAERWIVNLIRNARLDAKIDSKLVRRFQSVQTIGDLLVIMQFSGSDVNTFIFCLRVMLSWGLRLPLFTSK